MFSVVTLQLLFKWLVLGDTKALTEPLNAAGGASQSFKDAVVSILDSIRHLVLTLILAAVVFIVVKYLIPLLVKK